MYKRTMAALLAASALALTVPAAAQAGPNHGVVYARGTTPLGKTYGRWAALWWKWIWGLSASVAPITQEGAVNCGQAQRRHTATDEVWFLGGILNATGQTTR